MLKRAKQRELGSLGISPAEAVAARRVASKGKRRASPAKAPAVACKLLTMSSTLNTSTGEHVTVQCG